MSYSKTIYWNRFPWLKRAHFPRMHFTVIRSCWMDVFPMWAVESSWYEEETAKKQKIVDRKMYGTWIDACTVFWLLLHWLYNRRTGIEVHYFDDKIGVARTTVSLDAFKNQFESTGVSAFGRFDGLVHCRRHGTLSNTFIPYFHLPLFAAVNFQSCYMYILSIR